MLMTGGPGGSVLQGKYTVYVIDLIGKTRISKNRPTTEYDELLYGPEEPTHSTVTAPDLGSAGKNRFDDRPFPTTMAVAE